MADIKLQDGKNLTVHCPNSGSMKTCTGPDWPVMISDSNNPKRKYRYTLEMIHNRKCWIGINTQLPNKIVKEAIERGQIGELAGYENILSEQKYGQNSRIDLLLKKKDEKCYVEIKNVTMVENNTFLFPDAVTERGLKHLKELAKMREGGYRTVMLYLIQRTDGLIFKPCFSIDPEYSKELREVYQKGVEILPYVAEVSPQKINVLHKVNFDLH
jgi:sugar fermentation stimulation protein A